MKVKILLWLIMLGSLLSVARAQNSKVTGVVISADDGLPLIGATVLVKGVPNLGTTTDYDGNFILNNVPANAKELTVSYVGMIATDVKIKPNLKIILQSDSKQLQETVVIGYGSSKKPGSVVGAVSTVGNEKINMTPIANFTDALQGQVSGLSVLSSSGEPTATAVIRLRGINSINAGVSPLFVLDGAPITASAFNSLSPGDIENISVLKDAASTSIYGSRAANGVIVITSKKGKLGQKAKVTLRAQYGVSNLIDDKSKMMNSAQYFTFREMLTPYLKTDADWLNHKEIITKNNIDTDWTDYIFADNTPTTQLDASVMGGSDVSSYYLSLNHYDNEGIEPLSDLRRESLRMNSEYKVNNWLKIGLNSNMGYQKFVTNPEAGASDIYKTNPSVFARVTRPDDSPYYYTLDSNNNATFGQRADYLTFSQGWNPLYIADQRERVNRQVNLDMNLYEDIRPIKGLILRASQALSALDYTYSSLVKPVKDFETPMGDKLSYNSGSGSRTEQFQRSYNFTYTNTAEYKFDINQEHLITALLGQESIIGKNSFFGAMRNGITDERLNSLVDGTAEPQVTQGEEKSVFNSFFFNGNYGFRERYYLDLSFRTDGSSKFAPGHRWANFYSVGAKWILSREAFLSSSTWINDLSVNASIGTTGNSSIANYMYFGTLSGSNVNYNGNNGIGLSQPSNPNLTWETVKSINAGVKGRFWNRLNAEVQLYHKKTSDMLMAIPYSYTTGYGGGYGNIGAMVNKGIDIDLNVDIIARKELIWTARANFNYNKNEITELFNGLDEYVLSETGLKLQVGKPYGEFYMVERAGVDPRDGKQLWVDCNGNLTKEFNEERDAKFSGKQRFAPYTGGFGTQVMYKGISLTADFTFALGKYAVNNDRYFYENPKGFGSSYNQCTNVLNMWTTPGQITDVPAATESIQFDTHLLENASFLRMKNITLAYTLPESLLRKTNFLERVNIYLTGRNLLTATKFTGYDPEPDSNVIQFNYPNTKQYLIGCEITF